MTNKEYNHLGEVVVRTKRTAVFCGSVEPQNTNVRVKPQNLEKIVALLKKRGIPYEICEPKTTLHGYETYSGPKMVGLRLPMSGVSAYKLIEEVKKLHEHCSECHHPVHKAGDCGNCNCGESEIVHHTIGTKIHNWSFGTGYAREGTFRRAGIKDEYAG